MCSSIVVLNVPPIVPSGATVTVSGPVAVSFEPPDSPRSIWPGGTIVVDLDVIVPV